VSAEVRYLTCAETAKLVRAALKQAFPGVRFSVRCDTYAGGASIDVGWTDGPTPAAVERVAKRFEGASVDPMADLKSYHESLLAGPDHTVEQVQFGADFIFCQRELSDGYAARLAQRLAELTGEPYDPTRRYVFGYQGRVIDEYGATALWQLANLDEGGEPR
jgi:Large polyvalent protein associated domain 29